MLFALHGFMGSGADFDPLRLRLSIPFTAPDLVGHGEHATFDTQCYTTASQVEYWIERIPKGSVLMGYSMGGRLALQLAVSYPEHFAALIVIGGTPGIEDVKLRHERSQWDLQQAQRLVTEGTRTFYEYWRTLPIIASQSSIPQKVFEPMVHRRLNQDPTMLGLSMIHFGTGTMPNCWSKLKLLTMPILLVVGESDQKYRLIAESMLTTLPNGKISIIQRAGHCAHLENIAHSCTEIQRFLRQNSLI